MFVSMRRQPARGSSLQLNWEVRRPRICAIEFTRDSGFPYRTKSMITLLIGYTWGPVGAHGLPFKISVWWTLRLHVQQELSSASEGVIMETSHSAMLLCLGLLTWFSIISISSPRRFGES